MFTWLKSLRHGVGRHFSAEALSRAIVPVIESMESRRLLSSCSLSSGMLTVTGDSVADTLDVSTVSGTLSASDGGTQISGCAYSEASVTAIVVNAGDGDDTVN